jgi:acyl dehydratase
MSAPNATVSPRGAHFEQLEIGTIFRTAARTVTEADVVNFCGVSGDFNSLHTDAALMAESAFGGRIAHGALVLSMVTGLRVQSGFFEGTLIAFAGLREWRFEKPVLIGETIHAVNEVIELRETSRGDRGLVVQRVEVVNGSGEVVQRGEVVSMVRREAAT